MLADQPRIVLDPKIAAGKPVVRGTRLAVEFVIGLLADGWSEAEVLANYPGLVHGGHHRLSRLCARHVELRKGFPSAA